MDDLIDNPIDSEIDARLGDLGVSFFSTKRADAAAEQALLVDTMAIGRIIWSDAPPSERAAVRRGLAQLACSWLGDNSTDSDDYVCDDSCFALADRAIAGQPLI
jgi:hypothetical protein